MSRRFCFLTLFIMVFASSFAQVHKERRVYYLDITGSMKPIWADVVGNLKKAIENVADQTVDLEVVTWTDSDNSHRPQRKEVKATPQGKRELAAFIDAIKLDDNCRTEIYVPFEDFYGKSRSADCDTYFYLMTDGINHSSTRGRLESAINNWRAKTDDRCYGFYVMLTKEAAAADIKEKIERQHAQLWAVETADVNINQVKLERNSVWVVRDAEYVDIPVEGDLSGVSLSFSGQNAYYKVVKGEKATCERGNVFRLYIKKEDGRLPEEETLSVSVTAEQLPQFSFLLTREIAVRCVNKMYPTMSFTFKD